MEVRRDAAFQGRFLGQKWPIAHVCVHFFKFLGKTFQTPFKLARSRLRKF
jgi:hypothetical protein